MSDDPIRTCPSCGNEECCDAAARLREGIEALVKDEQVWVYASVDYRLGLPRYLRALLAAGEETTT